MLKRITCLMLLLPSIVLAQPLDRVVAVVNDGVITANELDTQVQVMRQQLAAKKMPLPGDTILRKQVLQHLIDVDLELQMAKQNNLTVEDAELNDAISKIATNNHLTVVELREEILRQGMTWKGYRENIRKEILLSQLQQKAVGKDVVVTAQQVDDYLKNSVHEDTSHYTYHVQNIVIPLPEEPTTAQLKKAQQKAAYLLMRLKKGDDFNRLAIEHSSDEFALEGGDLGERHIAELPELFAKKVVQMKVGQVSGPLRAGNGLQLIKLIQIGGNNEKHHVVKTHVRHILLKQDANMTSEEANKQANNLYQQLKSGKDFAAMAKQYSLDTASATQGGDLGWVNSGELVPQFEKAMNTLAPHQISKPIKTTYGWHLIEVLERKTVDDSASFKRQQVQLFLQQRKFTEAVHNWQQHLRSNAYIKIIDKDLA